MVEGFELDQELLRRRISYIHKGKKAAHKDRQCYEGYVPLWCRGANSRHFHRPFDEGEIRTLFHALEEMSRRGMTSIDWTRICVCLPGRTAAECRDFVLDILEVHENLKAGKR